MSVRAQLIDYGAGNIASAYRALEAAGWDVQVATKPEPTDRADLLVIPGVGHFGQCATAIARSGFAEVINDRLHAGKPLLGICVGLQVLYTKSEEAPGVPGLGLIPGAVVRIPDDGIRAVPHMGWNTLKVSHPSPVVSGIDNEYLYFVHSYMVVPATDHTLAVTDHEGVTIPAIIQEGPLLATQFHPEKSGVVGRRFLSDVKELSWV
ncbi:imidazole glycerol phosphate synthase subunit HisH [Stomatohabitans albus]|uniref:imidazole glycerol phosphate synthase subunit HisH n=1 Tax=Stomatohabitans albus TaxID=3110766 RepID=UPI00300CAF33